MPAILVWKTIKPARLKEPDMKREVRAGLKRVMRGIQKDYARTVSTWDNKPEFTQQESTKPTGPSVLVGTDDLIYKYVDEGTGLWGPKHKSYEIWPGAYTGKSDKKALAFRGVYTSKTLPGVLDARKGGKSGPWVVRPYVVHPGIKPRGFTEKLQKEWQPKFKREMETAMVRAARASGHGG